MKICLFDKIEHFQLGCVGCSECATVKRFRFGQRTCTTENRKYAQKSQINSWRTAREPFSQSNEIDRNRSQRGEWRIKNEAKSCSIGIKGSVVRFLVQLIDFLSLTLVRLLNRIGVLQNSRKTLIRLDFAGRQIGHESTKYNSINVENGAATTSRPPCRNLPKRDAKLARLVVVCVCVRERVCPLCAKIAETTNKRPKMIWNS